jgi:phage-related protein
VDAGEGMKQRRNRGLESKKTRFSKLKREERSKEKILRDFKP